MRNVGAARFFRALHLFSTAWPILAALLVSAVSTRAEDIWIDTDPAIGSPFREVDDAYALLFAFQAPDLWIAGISTTYGNAPVPRTTEVARDLVRRFRPENRLSAASVFSGADSRNDLGQSTAATDALALALAGKKSLTYLALGPLTNLATFVQLHPSLAAKIKRVIFVGGRSPEARLGFGPGERFRIHDANVFKDPEAVRIVLHSKIPIALVPIETAAQLTLRPTDLDQLRTGPARAAFLARNSRFWMWFWIHFVRAEGAPVFDAAAVMSVARPRNSHDDVRFAQLSGRGDLLVRLDRGTTGRRVRWCTQLAPDATLELLRRLGVQRNR